MPGLFSTLEMPIMQAPIGSACSIELAAAVANAGGIGSMALTWDEPGAAVATVETLNKETDGFYAINFVLHFNPPAIDAVLEAGPRMVTLSWGMCSEVIRKVRAARIPLGIQVGSVEGARQALTAGADFLVCQGMEAGGHVQSSSSLAVLLPKVSALSSVPLIAAGGLATAADVSRVLEMGATVAALGTRFVNASESNAHPSYQQAIIAAGIHDTAFTCCFDGDWPLTNSRVLRNATLEQWEAGGCRGAGHRPGEGDLIATTTSGWQIPRYHIASPARGTTGNVLDLALYAGKSAAGINDVLPAAQIIEQLTSVRTKADRSRNNKTETTKILLGEY